MCVHDLCVYCVCVLEAQAIKMGLPIDERVRNLMIFVCP